MNLVSSIYAWIKCLIVGLTSCLWECLYSQNRFSLKLCIVISRRQSIRSRSCGIINIVYAWRLRHITRRDSYSYGRDQRTLYRRMHNLGAILCADIRLSDFRSHLGIMTWFIIFAEACWPLYDLWYGYSVNNIIILTFLAHGAEINSI